MSERIALVGLPGSGKSRFQKAFVEQVASASDEVDIFVVSDGRQKGKGRVWCLIDLRSPLKGGQAETHLKALLSISSAIVFTFVESSDLATQSDWQQWLKAQGVTLPIFRWFHQAFPQDWQWHQHGEAVDLTELDFPLLRLEKLTFGVRRVHLEHLMFGLDALKQNQGMNLWRVKAQVETVEYANPVALEGTFNRWDTFAAEQATHRIEILGDQLDEDWLRQVVDASQL